MAPKYPGRRTPRRSPCPHSTCTLIVQWMCAWRRRVNSEVTLPRQRPLLSGERSICGCPIWDLLCVSAP
eukprot:934264-Prymnesium_polylepis.1